MRARDPIIALVLAAVLAAPAGAEPQGSHLQITPYGGFTIFDSQLRPTGSTLRDGVYMGARLGWQMTSWGGIEAAGGVTPAAEDIPGGIDVTFTHLSGNLMFTPLQRRGGGPFFSVGGGVARLKPAGGDNINLGTLDVAAGVRLWLSDAVGLRLEARDIHYLPKYAYQSSADFLVVGGGLTLALGATPRDTDGDGVPDRRDKCPDTPRGARVDENGCPLDGDGDKVFDGLDQCPDTPKGCTVDAKGCPSDADGDGVCDGVDTCPDTPKGATVNATGCPSDADDDKVLDGLDQCPGTPKGCTVDARGCPSDTDGDGVCDGLDRCPDTTPGLKVDSDGCPIELVERETELLDTGMIRLQNINFETNKADILPESLPTLDIVGQVLGKWPELRIEVGGHTDARGSDKHNQKLSEARANSVLTYLTTKFTNLKAEQFTVKGYGEGRPLVPNTGALNWAKNRRVEFVVLNKDVLRREVERRRLLKRDEGGAPRDTSSSAPPDTTKR
ncbi:MAG TPA: OmpA family protein [Candidatus Eisenbacteria bacterium]|nr:OmpA family protein [Candidatus Eisenbacteria bacterium]